MSDALRQVYSKKILALAADIPRGERLADPDASSSQHSPLCGSRITIDLKLDGDDRITDYGQSVRACTLGQAASAIVGRHVVGRTGEEMLALRERMRAMLKDNGPPPDDGFAHGEWSDLALLEPAREIKMRHGSIMLAFDAVAEAVEAARQRRQG